MSTSVRMVEQNKEGVSRWSVAGELSRMAKKKAEGTATTAVHEIRLRDIAPSVFAICPFFIMA